LPRKKIVTLVANVAPEGIRETRSYDFAVKRCHEFAQGER
jgi:hypothetical protein